MVWDYKITKGVHIYPIRLILFVIWSIQLDKPDIWSDFLLFEIFQIEYLNIFESDTGWKFSFSNIQNIGFFSKNICVRNWISDDLIRNLFYELFFWKMYFFVFRYLTLKYGYPRFRIAGLYDRTWVAFF